MEKHTPDTNDPESYDRETDLADQVGLSRRDFLKSTAAGAVAGAIGGHGLTSVAQAADDGPNFPTSGKILIHGGVVMSLDPDVGDFEQADVLVDVGTKKILAVQPNLKKQNPDAFRIDANGMLVMPGFINTHHHQYYGLQRSIIADGPLTGAWPARTYNSVPSAIWTAGRIPGVFDLGRSPYDPQDCYISELIASYSCINAGVTTGIDTSQSSHTPEHTDALIQGILDSGRRTLYAYSTGTNRGAEGGYNVPTSPYEYPGALGDSTRGLGRLKATYFASDDQLATLALNSAYNADNYALARSLGVPLVQHGGLTPAGIAANAYGQDNEFIHGTGFPDEHWVIIKNVGAHISIAPAIEMQMGHGIPPIQEALDHGILPSLSSDVETNMAADMFTLMRAAFCLQRMLIFNRMRAGETNVPPLLTCYQVVQMGTIAGARCAHLDHKVGTLTPGKEADIIMLAADAVNVTPMNNAPGTVVTMMDTSNVRHVMIAGKIRKWKGKLVDVDTGMLHREITAARDRVLERILNSNWDPNDPLRYNPTMFGSCCVDQTYDAE